MHTSQPSREDKVDKFTSKIWLRLRVRDIEKLAIDVLIYAEAWISIRCCHKPFGLFLEM